MGDVDRRLWERLEPWLEAEGIELDDLDVRGSGAGRVVRVIVDAPEGVDIERIADLSRGVARIVDEENWFDGGYTLEVSSPGLERPLRRPEQYRKVVGREVVIKTRAPIGGATSHRGLLRTVAGDAVAVAVGDEERTIALADVVQARTVFRWEKAPKPGKRGAE